MRTALAARSPRWLRPARGRRPAPSRRAGVAVIPPLARPGGGRAVAAEVAEHAVEPAPLDPLHRVVAEAADLADVEDRDDVRVVQPGGGPRLVQEPSAAVRVGRGVGAEHLQRDRAVEPDVDRLVDDPHAAAAQLADDPVAGDPPPRFEPDGPGRAGRRPGPAPAPGPPARRGGRRPGRDSAAANCSGSGARPSSASAR